MGMPVIAVVAKAPVAGLVKTRMRPPLSAQQAADLAAAMLRDVTRAALETGAAVWWSYAGDAAVLDDLRPPGVQMLAQVGADLAERLAHAHATLHAVGADRVILVGADCPAVDVAALHDALGLLRSADVVLGPATDGGYTLLGTAICAPTLFSAVTMSTARTGADTLGEARRLGLRAAVMDARPDIDTFPDLRAALADGWLQHAPHTRAATERLLRAIAAG